MGDGDVVCWDYRGGHTGSNQNFFLEDSRSAPGQAVLYSLTSVYLGP